MSNSFIPRLGKKLIGGKIIGINYEVEHPAGFRFVIRILYEGAEYQEIFFAFDREIFGGLDPLDLLGRFITEVEAVSFNDKKGIRLTVCSGHWIALYERT